MIPLWRPRLDCVVVSEWAGRRVGAGSGLFDFPAFVSDDVVVSAEGGEIGVGGGSAF